MGAVTAERIAGRPDAVRALMLKAVHQALSHEREGGKVPSNRKRLEMIEQVEEEVNGEMTPGAEMFEATVPQPAVNAYPCTAGSFSAPSRLGV